MSRHYQVTVDGIAFEVALIARSANSIEFSLNGKVHHVAISAPLRSLRSEGTSNTPQHFQPSQSHSTPPTHSATVAGGVNAPMPGIIAKILVAVGDPVSLGQPLIVVEAMKMENSICAPVAGVIERLEVLLGSEVKKGQLLVIIK